MRRGIVERVLAFAKRMVGSGITNMQGFYVYRMFVRAFQVRYELKEADEEDMRKVHAWLNPGGNVAPVRCNPNVTDWVAKRRDRVIGFVQLVRRPEGNQPYAGYWLFSLTVMVPYRGMGIGESLCSRVIEKARDEGAEELLLIVRVDRDQAISLYRKLGFVIKTIPVMEVQLEKETLAYGYRRVVMSKSLLCK